MASVELKSIRKSFGSVEVIRDVSLKISEGEFVVLVGPSGCGKSTLLRCIAGLEPVSSGTLLLDGVDQTDADPIARGVAMDSGGLPFFASLFLGTAFLSFYNGPVTAVIHDVVPNEIRATAFAVYLLVVHLLGDTFAPADKQLVVKLNFLLQR